MGGGGLRILPHKKWHVWRRENIERVLKDEREHEEKQKDLDANERRLEQERRAQQLLLTEGQDDAHHKQRQHMNFFKAEEAQARSREGVTHRRKPCSGADDTLRRHGKLPWYAQPEDAKKKDWTAREERKRKREWNVADPLQQMRPKDERGQRPLWTAWGLDEQCQSRYRCRADGPAGSDCRKYSARYDCSLASSRRGDWRHDVGEEEADRASNKRSKHGEKKCKSKHESGKKEALLQDLRRERQERETSERRRAQKLLYG